MIEVFDGIYYDEHIFKKDVDENREIHKYSLGIQPNH